MLSKMQTCIVDTEQKSKMKTTFLSVAHRPVASHKDHISLTESFIPLGSIGWKYIKKKKQKNLLHCKREQILPGRGRRVGGREVGQELVGRNSPNNVCTYE
jgi:hypothetical protein